MTSCCLLLILLLTSSNAFISKWPQKLRTCGLRSSFEVDGSQGRGNGEKIPYPGQVLADDVEIKRLLGKIDVVDDNGKRDTLVRVFEAYLKGRRAWLKEYLPSGKSLGKRELSTTKRAIKLYNSMIDEEGPGTRPLPVPLVIGSLKTDMRIEDANFKDLWRRNFPKVRPPQAGNIWLIYSWDQFSFKSLRSYPPLPQIVEPGDYFSPRKRAEKRWRFVRMIMFRTLEVVDFLHRTGVSHNTLNSDSVWLSTTNEQDLTQVHTIVTDLGASLSLRRISVLTGRTQYLKISIL